MKKNNFKLLLSFSFVFLSLYTTAQVASDEDTRPITTCTDEGTNVTRTSSDLPNAVNVGTIDDRSCYADYNETTIDGTVWGIYNITDGSNHMDAPNTLQPRIERSLPRSQGVGIGSYALFNGTVRILEVGDTNGTSNDGSYLIQAKGKHTGGGGSNDPAICLYLAKPVYGRDTNGNLVQVSFNVFREQINFRGGSGAVGRDIVFLTNIKKNVPTNFKLEVGFREDPNDSSKKVHYADAVIGGEVFNWNIPEPERGVESGIRYGAYRVKGGRAQIRWANTTYQRVVKTDTSNNVDLSGDIYSLKNVATGKYLTDAGVSAKPVTMSDADESQETFWEFVESGAFVNIESVDFGILRGPGASFAEGPYRVVSTSKNAPATDSDKVWTIHYNESDDTYRYESATSGRYLYHEENGNVTHIIVPETDSRSKWKAISKNSALSTENNSLNTTSIKVYPNPTNNKFRIRFNNIEKANVKIYNLLGKVVYENTIQEKSIEIENNGKYPSGLYLIKVTADNQKVYHTKLLIR